MTEREAELEAACGVMRAALEPFVRLHDWALAGKPAEAEIPRDVETLLRGAAAALHPSAGARAAAILALVTEWERANREHYACWQTPGYEREREEQLRERIRSAQGRLLEAARESGTEGP